MINVRGASSACNMAWICSTNERSAHSLSFSLCIPPLRYSMSAVPQIYAAFLFGFFEGSRGATVWHSDAKVKWQATKKEREEQESEWELAEKCENSLELLQVCCVKIVRRSSQTIRILRTSWKLFVYIFWLYIMLYNLFITWLCWGCFNWFYFVFDVRFVINFSLIRREVFIDRKKLPKAT